MNRIKLSRGVVQQGHTVDEAENGKQALEMLGADGFDLVLLDIIMPEMDGYQVLEQMKLDTNLRDIPVVVISALDDLQSVVRCIEMGAEDYLPKSFDPVLLKARIGASLEKKRLRDQEALMSENLREKSNALEQLSNQLAKYLSPQVYDSIFTGKQEVKLVSQRKKLTVFFSDIVDFTETTDRLESEDLTRLLNHYLTEMSQIAVAHGATIDKFVGDAIVIFFGDPESLGVKEDALACVNMAIAMRKKLAELEGVWRESGLEKPFQCRIGISTAVCTVGNFGSEDRMDYTIIGGGVNLAARLETASIPGEILISYETYAHVKDQIHAEEHGQIEVKGLAYPVATYKVLDHYENLDEAKRPIRAKSPHFQFDADVALMSPEERQQVSAMLLEAAERLTKIDAKT
jgi:class 3 adenylate cyclase